MCFMAQITIRRPLDFDIALQLHRVLPPTCATCVFTDAHLTDQTNIFIYGEREQFYAIEAVLQSVRKKNGTILADFVR